MGNTPSHPNEGGSTPSHGSSAPGTTNNGTSTPTNNNTSTPTPAQPIAANVTTSSSPFPMSQFHSGLTPPQRTPSPPPPSTPPLLPYGGHLSPQNPHALILPQAKDYSKTIVTRLVMEARLAPFYRGLEDYEENFTETDIAKMLDEVREKDYQENVPNSVVEQTKMDREGPSKVGQQVVKKIGIHKARDHKHAEEREEAYRREKRAYVGAIECPICFLSYPPNINTTRCCQQPICTECFVQIKRSEPSLTHLVSEPSSCPFCVETDFGVIYERPPIPSVVAGTGSGSALSLSPHSPTLGGAGEGLSQALTSNTKDAELSVGIGMAPKEQETVRRKSVNHTAKEVVTTDEIRPDWELKLNAVKAAAARKAARRVVMRQVGDRLIPIGYTSARAPGTANFDVSGNNSASRSGTGSGTSTPSRRERRRTGSRGRDLEELMIMEAMRLSLIDHEEHQRRQDDEISRGSLASPGGSAIILPATSSAPSNRRVSDGALMPPQSKASKILSKFGGRSRAGSAASSLRAMSFSPSNSNLPGHRSGTVTPRGDASSPPVSSPANPGSSSSVPTTSSPLSPSTATSVPTPSLSRSPPKGLTPQSAAPVAPITTLANANPTPGSSGSNNKTRTAPPPEPLGLPTPTATTNPSTFPEQPAVPSSSRIPASSPQISPTHVEEFDPIQKQGASIPNVVVDPPPIAAVPIAQADSSSGMPRISLDMAPLTPSHGEAENSTANHAGTDKTGGESVKERAVPPAFGRSETGLSTVPSERAYAALDSDEEE